MVYRIGDSVLFRCLEHFRCFKHLVNFRSSHSTNTLRTARGDLIYIKEPLLRHFVWRWWDLIKILSYRNGSIQKLDVNEKGVRIECNLTERILNSMIVQFSQNTVSILSISDSITCICSLNYYNVWTIHIEDLITTEINYDVTTIFTYENVHNYFVAKPKCSLTVNYVLTNTLFNWPFTN